MKRLKLDIIFKINDGGAHLPTKPITVKVDSIVYKYNGTEDRGEFHSEFMKKVENDSKNKPGEYEKDFPVYFINATKKYISIHEYRKLYKKDKDEEFEKKGDYLMILIKDSIQIDHPKNKSYKKSQVSDENTDDIPSSFNLGEIEEKKRKERIKRRNREKQDSIKRAKKKQDSLETLERAKKEDAKKAELDQKIADATAKIKQAEEDRKLAKTEKDDLDAKLKDAKGTGAETALLAKEVAAADKAVEDIDEAIKKLKESIADWEKQKKDKKEGEEN